MVNYISNISPHRNANQNERDLSAELFYARKTCAAQTCTFRSSEIFRHNCVFYRMLYVWAIWAAEAEGPRGKDMTSTSLSYSARLFGTSNLRQRGDICWCSLITKANSGWSARLTDSVDWMEKRLSCNTHWSMANCDYSTEQNIIKTKRSYRISS